MRSQRWAGVRGGRRFLVSRVQVRRRRPSRVTTKGIDTMTKHEITGRDYLSVTSYGFFLAIPRGKRDGWWQNHFWSKRHEDEQGRVWWTTRWPSHVMGRLYRLRRRTQPLLCH